FFNDTATTEIYTLSLHDALPICGNERGYRPLEQYCGGGGRPWRELFRRRAQLWRRAGTSGPGPRALSQELLPRLQDRRAHEGGLAQATGRIAAAAEDGSRRSISVPCIDKDDRPGRGSASRRRNGDDGSCEKGRQDSLHRLLGAL